MILIAGIVVLFHSTNLALTSYFVAQAFLAAMYIAFIATTRRGLNLWLTAAATTALFLVALLSFPTSFGFLFLLGSLMLLAAAILAHAELDESERE